MIKLQVEPTDENRRWLLGIFEAREPVVIAGREAVLSDLAIGADGITAVFAPILLEGA